MILRSENEEEMRTIFASKAKNIQKQLSQMKFSGFNHKKE